MMGDDLQLSDEGLWKEGAILYSTLQQSIAIEQTPRIAIEQINDLLSF